MVRSVTADRGTGKSEAILRLCKQKLSCLLCLIQRNLGLRKSRCFPHDFEGFPLKKQNVEVKKGIRVYVVRIFIHFDGAISYYLVATRHESYQNPLSAELSNSGRNLSLFDNHSISQDATRFHGRSIYLRTFLSFKDFNLLKSLAASARSFFNFMTACYFPCLHVTQFLSSDRKILGSVDSVSTVVVLCE